MQIVICQTCEKVIEYNQDEKISTVYGISEKCDCHKEEEMTGK